VLLPAGTPVIIKGASSLTVAGEPLTVAARPAVRQGQPLTAQVSSDGLGEVAWRVVLPAGWTAGADAGTLGTPATAVPGPQRVTLLLRVRGEELVWPLDVEVLPEVVEV
jgi:hypothetical protein